MGQKRIVMIKSDNTKDEWSSEDICQMVVGSYLFLLQIVFDGEVQLEEAIYHFYSMDPEDSFDRYTMEAITGCMDHVPL